MIDRFDNFTLCQSPYDIIEVTGGWSDSQKVHTRGLKIFNVMIKKILFDAITNKTTVKFPVDMIDVKVEFLFLTFIDFVVQIN